MTANALAIGKAAEHIVCADLILAGFDEVFLSDQGLPYDVLVGVAGGRFVRVQVKATQKPRELNRQGRHLNVAYNFNVRRRGKHGAGDRLSRAHCDVVALVALDVRAVAYFRVEDCAQTMTLFPRGHEFKGNYKRSRRVSIDGFPFAEAMGAAR